jgi:CubicO group peptidase (beta-lactamase class C family)
MSARAMASMYAALLGEVDGVRLISPERLREISAPAFSGEDQIMGNPVTWALGYAIGRIGTEAYETPSVFGMGGVGGSYACADTATGVAWALTKNRLTPDFGAAEQIAEIVAKAVAAS